MADLAILLALIGWGLVSAGQVYRISQLRRDLQALSARVDRLELR